MSTAPKYPRELGYAGLRMTADEYLALGETLERYELIDGLVIVSPAQTPIHSEVLGEIAYQLMDFATEIGTLHVFHSTDVVLDRRIVYRPDICAYSADRLPAKVNRLESPPDLIVEILSEGSKALDLITKRDDYERFGVGEYWVVDPSNAQVRCWTRNGSRLVDTPPGGDTIQSKALAGFSLDLLPIRRLVAGT